MFFSALPTAGQK